MNFLSNLTILSLTRQSFAISPHFSVPLISNNQKISFYSGKYQNFFSPFYYSQKQNNNLYLSACTFQNFLDRVININQKYFENQTFFSFLVPIKQSFDETIIKNCKFCGIKSFHVKGGAIVSFSDIKIRNSAFLKCTSKGYGTIASFSLISIKNTVFYKNVALFTSSIFSDSENSKSFQINYSSFNKCKSRICLGIIYRPSPSDGFNFAYNNLSTSVVKGDYGSVIVNRSKTYFAYSFISNIIKSKYNCGIYIQTNYFTKIESCIFCNLSRTSTDSNFGIALQIEISEKTSFIQNCIFGKMEVTAPLFFCSFNNILVNNSCFYQKREEVALLPFFDFINCTYGKPCSIENKINLSTIIHNEDDIETTNIINGSYIRNEFEYDLYAHLPFLLLLFLIILYFSLNYSIYSHHFITHRHMKNK